jgi:Fic family protein
MDGRFFEVDAQLNALREREAQIPRSLVEEYTRRLDISWIYHDSALEGVVLSYAEIKAAIDRNIISDVSLIPSYEEIKSFKAAVDWSRELADNRKRPIGVEAVRKIYSLVTPDEAAKGIPYRRDNPLHRLYYHEISPPEKITYRMRKLGEWLEEDATRRMHPVERAAKAHFRLMNIYPWTLNSGRVARILSNLMLARDGYLPAIVHSIDRQRYYEALRAEHLGITQLYLEACATSIETALKFYAEATATVRRRAAS